jgi:hypothetical protein
VVERGNVGRRRGALVRGRIAGRLAVAPVAIALVSLLGAGTAAFADEPGGAIGERVRSFRPVHETWQDVPWRTDLGVARREAARTGRPLFLWAMNGNPLGCT